MHSGVKERLGMKCRTDGSALCRAGLAHSVVGLSKHLFGRDSYLMMSVMFVREHIVLTRGGHSVISNQFNVARVCVRGGGLRFATAVAAFRIADGTTSHWFLWPTACGRETIRNLVCVSQDFQTGHRDDDFLWLQRQAETAEYLSQRFSSKTCQHVETSYTWAETGWQTALRSFWCFQLRARTCLSDVCECSDIVETRSLSPSCLLCPLLRSCTEQYRTGWGMKPLPHVVVVERSSLHFCCWFIVINLICKIGGLYKIKAIEKCTKQFGWVCVLVTRTRCINPLPECESLAQKLFTLLPPPKRQKNGDGSKKAAVGTALCHSACGCVDTYVPWLNIVFWRVGVKMSILLGCMRWHTQWGTRKDIPDMIVGNHLISVNLLSCLCWAKAIGSGNSNRWIRSTCPYPSPQVEFWAGSQPQENFEKGPVQDLPEKNPISKWVLPWTNLKMWQVLPCLKEVLPQTCSGLTGRPHRNNLRLVPPALQTCPKMRQFLPYLKILGEGLPQIHPTQDQTKGCMLYIGKRIAVVATNPWLQKIKAKVRGASFHATCTWVNSGRYLFTSKFCGGPLRRACVLKSVLSWFWNARLSTLLAVTTMSPMCAKISSTCFFLFKFYVRSAFCASYFQKDGQKWFLFISNHDQKSWRPPPPLTNSCRNLNHLQK